MKTRVTDPKDLRVGDRVGPFVVEYVDPNCKRLTVRFYGQLWQDDAVVAELLKLHEVWHDDPEPDVPGERIVARGKVTRGCFIGGVLCGVWVLSNSEPGDEIIVVRGETE